MSNILDIYDKKGEPLEEYRNFPIIVFDVVEDVERYLEKKSKKIASERAPLDASYEEWEKIYYDVYNSLLEENFDEEYMISEDQLESIKEKTREFELENDIFIYPDRKEYGEYQICIEGEEKLSEDDIKKARSFMNKLVNEYHLFVLDK